MKNDEKEINNKEMRYYYEGSEVLHMLLTGNRRRVDWDIILYCFALHFLKNKKTKKEREEVKENIKKVFCHTHTIFFEKDARDTDEQHNFKMKKLMKKIENLTDEIIRYADTIIRKNKKNKKNT